MTKITYLLSQNEWNEYSEYIQGLVRAYNVRIICDIGGGANPVLPLEFIEAHLLDCTVLDISSKELEKAPKGYKKLVQDMEAVDFPETGQFDFVVTKMMAEHVRNGRLFHKNVYLLLKPGGIAVHYFPTLYALPYLVNKLIPEWLSSFLLDIFLPRDRYQTGKFPAYYSWTYGPTPPMLKMLREIGYEIVEYRGFFGTTYYSRIPIVREIHRAYTVFLSKHPNPYLTSWAQVILRKPTQTL
ncbi:MAG: methyltransferase domain-containing protein [Chloroflexi bacterium]|nr:methyltransferase domain-containing protein [Chloroflexota bacterium]